MCLSLVWSKPATSPAWLRSEASGSRQSVNACSGLGHDVCQNQKTIAARMPGRSRRAGKISLQPWIDLGLCHDSSGGYWAARFWRFEPRFRLRAHPVNCMGQAERANSQDDNYVLAAARGPGVTSQKLEARSEGVSQLRAREQRQRQRQSKDPTTQATRA